MMDPIGLSLENFTPVGNYRATENGVPIDASGTFEGKTYKNAIDLTHLLHDSPTVPACAVQRVFEYGVGRKVAANEQAWLETADADFAKAGYRFPDLLRLIATSAAFQGEVAPPVAKAAAVASLSN
jgi:hypothetical protein